MKGLRTSGCRSAEHRRCSDDGGAVIIEFAMVLPLLIFALLGIFEFGTAWRNTTIIASALRAGARVEAHHSQNAKIDYQALLAVTAGVAQTDNITLTKVIVYKVPVLDVVTSWIINDGVFTGQVTDIAGCVDSPAGTYIAGCNIYEEDMLDDLEANEHKFSSLPDGNCSPDDWDFNWCPNTRKVSMEIDDENYGPDILGIYAEAEYTTMTRLLAATITLRDFVDVQLEPEVE